MIKTSLKIATIVLLLQPHFLLCQNGDEGLNGTTAQQDVPNQFTNLSNGVDHHFTHNLTDPIHEKHADFSYTKADKSERNSPKNIFSLKMGADDPWFGITYERIFFKYVGAEVQLGLIGASAGAKLYFPAIRNKRINFYAGVLPGWGFAGGRITYFPIGINAMSSKNFRFSIDAGPRIWHDDNDNFPGFSLKIGKGF